MVHKHQRPGFSFCLIFLMLNELQEAIKTAGAKVSARKELFDAKNPKLTQGDSIRHAYRICPGCLDCSGLLGKSIVGFKAERPY